MDYRVTIKEMPVELRPRERLTQQGPEVLSNGELVAILLRTGNQNQSALELAAAILTEVKGINGLASVSTDDLRQVKGVGIAKAAQIMAALELGKRIACTGPEQRPIISSPADVANLVMAEMRHLDKEHFRIMILNTKNQVLVTETISVGSLNVSVVHPREVFKAAIKKSGASVVLIHNHPSGNPHPSKEDIEVTKRLTEGGKLLGISILDHVVIGDNKFYSFKENSLC